MKYSISIDNKDLQLSKELFIMQTYGDKQVSKDIEGKIDYAISLLKKEIKCYCIDKEFELYFNENGAYVKEDNLLCGKDVSERLKGSNKAYFFIVTLGIGVDRLISKLQLIDITTAYLIDNIASVIVDVISQKIQDNIAKNRIIYERYSCGYGDYLISLQQNICNELQAEKIGVKLTSGDMFVPSKTISAVIGIVGEKNV